MASNCNGKKWSAKVAGEQSIDLFLALYIGMNGAMKEEAVVISVMDYSLDVLVLSTGSTHRVYTNVRPQLSFHAAQLRRYVLFGWARSGLNNKFATRRS